MTSGTQSSNPVYRFFVDEEKRTLRAYEAPKRPDREHWKLLHYCHQVKLLAERRIAFGNDVSAKATGDELAIKCHEVLDTLLETIGLHAQEKSFILERLSLRLRGSQVDGNVVIAEIQPPSNQRLLEAKTPSALSCASLSGVVIEHLKDAAVIRFNVCGESEEREFLWKDLNAQPESLPVGTMVVGETRLLRAPSSPTDDEVGQHMRRIHHEVEQELKERGIDSHRIIGSEPDEALRQRSAKAWADNSELKP